MAILGAIEKISMLLMQLYLKKESKNITFGCTNIINQCTKLIEKMTQRYHTFSMAILGTIEKISMLLMQLYLKKEEKFITFWVHQYYFRRLCKCFRS